MGVLFRIATFVAVAVLSACVSRAGGVPVAVHPTPSQPDPLTARSVFDDFTTAAPCSLTALSVFEPFGTAEFGAPESTFDYCTVIVETTSGGTVAVNVGLLGELVAIPDPQSRRAKDVQRGVWVGQADADPGSCTQLLVFPDDVTVEVRAYEVAPDVDTCPMTEAAMDHMVDVILDDGVSHRSPAQNSLIKVDPCALLADDNITAIPVLHDVRRNVDYPGKHKCYWDAGTAAGAVVDFGAGPSPSTDARQNVAGRTTVITPVEVDERSYRTVETPHIPFTEVVGMDPYVERAAVFVRLPPGNATEACTAARTVAELVWPRLPS